MWVGGTPAGGAANVCAYASLPRKYSPLRKLNASPSGTASPARSRSASGKVPRPPNSSSARRPPQLAGESMKICVMTRHGRAKLSPNCFGNGDGDERLAFGAYDDVFRSALWVNGMTRGGDGTAEFVRRKH